MFVFCSPEAFVTPIASTRASIKNTFFILININRLFAINLFIFSVLVTSRLYHYCTFKEKNLFSFFQFKLSFGLKQLAIIAKNIAFINNLFVWRQQVILWQSPHF